MSFFNALLSSMPGAVAQGLKLMESILKPSTPMSNQNIIIL